MCESSQNSSGGGNDTNASVRDSPEVEDCTWYHGYLTRDENNRLLRSIGDFILRQTEPIPGQGFQLVLSIQVEGKACHFTVCMTAEGQFYVNRRRTFATVSQMVQHYMNSGEEINEGTHAVCRTPIPRQRWELLSSQKSSGSGNDTKASVRNSPEIEDCAWYHGYLPRDENNRLLRNIGDFILRQTEPIQGQGFQLVLSIRVEKVHHFTVCMTVEGRFYVNHRRAFATVSQMVQYYMNSGEEINERTHAVCRTPIPRQSWELLREQITVGELLGQGEFGAVYRGKLSQGHAEISVAVKLHKVKVLNKEAIKEVSTEARLLREYKHPNIMQFYGVSFDKEPIVLCMELADGGSLDSYLKKNKANIKTKLQMCVDAASGLAYLHSKDCIHRDVSARNCLVAKGHVKISDFGLAYQLAQSLDNGKGSNFEKMPIRWLAPEAMNGRYSLKSDVYSFGVLMWEIFSDAETPFKGKTLNQVFNEVRNKGLHLERPKSMPESVGRIMLDGCFVRDPEKRWTINKVREALEKIMKEFYGDNTISNRDGSTKRSKSTCSKREGPVKQPNSQRHSHKETPRKHPKSSPKACSKSTRHK